jgi:hypothetical protein
VSSAQVGGGKTRPANLLKTANHEGWAEGTQSGCRSCRLSQKPRGIFAIGVWAVFSSFITDSRIKAKQSNALLSRGPAVFVQACRLTMALIQIGAKGDVHPFDTG